MEGWKAPGDAKRDEPVRFEPGSPPAPSIKLQIELTTDRIPDCGDQTKNLMRIILQSNFEGNHFFIHESTDSKLDQYFNRLDRDRNGFLNANDFTSNIPSVYEERQRLWLDLKRNMDFDHDGKITKIEFYCYFVYDALQLYQSGASVTSGRFVSDMMMMRDQLNVNINQLADRRYNAISRLL